MKKIISIGMAALLTIPSVALSASIPTPKVLRPALSTGNLIFLGASYDAIQEKPLTERCIEASPQNLLDYTVLTNELISDAKYVSDHEEMHRFFTETNNAQAGVTFDALSGSGSGSMQITRETHFYKDTGAIAGKFIKSVNQQIAKPTGELADLKLDARKRYNNVADFRNKCGDGYISNVVNGVIYDFSLDIISINGSSVVTKSQKASAEGDIQKIFSVSASTSQVETIIKKYSNYKFRIFSYAYGVKDISGKVLMPLNLQEFADQVAYVRDSKNHLPAPLGAYVNGYQFSMPDIYTVKNNYNRWFSVSYEVDSRCAIFNNAKQVNLADSMLNNGTSVIDACAAATLLIDDNMNFCSDATKFGLCQAPIDSSCQWKGLACSDVVNGSLIPAWDIEDVHQRYAQKFKSGNTHVRVFTVCLPEDTVFDVSRGDDGYDRTSNNRNNLHTHVNTSYRCDKTTFSVKSKGGINFSSDIYLYGLKAQRTPLLSAGF